MASSAGILMYQRGAEGIRVLLVHPGGPFWRRRDLGAWSIPKGETADGELPEATARREFREELGVEAPEELHPLGRIRQRGGKTVEAFAGEGAFDPSALRCESLVTLEWPPRSGRIERFPEVDAAAWFPLALAQEKILAGQAPLLGRLAELLGTSH